MELEKQYLQEWKKSCIKIGTPTNLLAAVTAFFPVIWLCISYDCWPEFGLVMKAWGMVALSFGAFYIVEPLSYYAALGMSGTYLSFLSGNIGNMRVPCATLALDATDSQTGSLQAEVVSTMAICGSIFTNLLFTTLAALVGGVVVSVLPAFISVGLTKYAAAAIYGGTFGNLALKHPKTAVYSLVVVLIIKLVLGPPAWVLILVSVFGSILVSRFFFSREKKKA
ncbi:MAG: hypothetical protein ACRDBM_17845 [Sporomusa sp.]